MKPQKYSAVAVFFGLRKRDECKVDEHKGARLARISAETGVSERALSLFSKIGEHKWFSAESDRALGWSLKGETPVAAGVSSATTSKDET